MDDLSAVSLQERTLESTGWLDEARTFLFGFLFTAVMTVLGASLVTVALVVGVVAAPVVAAVLAYVLFRSRRAAHLRALAT